MRQLVISRLIFGTMLFGVCNANVVHAQNYVAYASQKTDATTYWKNDANNQKQELLSVLKQLNKEKGVYFLFSDESFGARLVNPLTETKESVEQILDRILKNTGLTYKKVSSDIYVIVTIKDKDENIRLSNTDTGVMTIQLPMQGIGFLTQETSAPASLITGHVVAKDGSSLVGVSVQIKGTSKGVVTNANGIFSIDANKGDVLVFSYVGFLSQEVTVGDGASVDITLLESQQQLNEVIVTALGIQRQSKSLTYAVQKVNNADLTNVKDANFINSLTGKVAGVTISKSASGIGGSTRVILRGNKSTRENQPLYVIDGVPMNNFNPAQPGDEWGQAVGYVGVDGGDGISNINPDDIESVSVLKGASAAALYGSAAANGVILITTKKGQAGTVRIDVSTETMFDNPLYKTPLQFKYGQTTPPSAGNPGSIDSWGGVVNAPNHVDDFFQTGVTSFNSLSLSGGTDKAQTYFSYSHLDNKGIVPTSSLQKNNFNFHETAKFFNDRLTADFNGLYLHQKTDNRPVSGLYDNPLTGLYEFPRGLDFDKYKTYEVFSPQRNTYIQNWWDNNYDSGFAGSETEQNPYWLLNRNASTNLLDRVYTNVSFNYKINSWLNVQARGNIDKSINTIDVESYATTSTVLTAQNGGYTSLRAINTQLYGDLLLMANKKLSESFNFNATVGTSVNDDKSEQNVFGTKTGGKGLNVPNIFVLSNIIPNDLTIAQTFSHRQVQAVFATAQLGWKNSLFVDVTGRNDWSSTFAYTPTENKGYFYYSAGLTGVLSDMFKMPEAISFSKVRVSYAKVGNDVDPYVTNAPPFYVTFDNNAITTINTLAPYPGTYLKPEDNRSFEAGTEWRFLNDKLGFDFTYYVNNNFNQYLQVPAPLGSGLSYYYLNGGNIKNSGVELSVYATPVKSKNVTWTTTVNYAYNDNQVVNLSNDQLKVQREYYPLTGLGNLLYASNLVVGGSWGDIYGRFFDRAPDGSIYVDSTGKPLKGNDPNSPVGDQQQKFLGNPNPKFTLGWNNTINIKNFSINFLFDGRFGGEVMSVTQAVLDGYGDSKETQDARDAGGVNMPATIKGGTHDGEKWQGLLPAQTFYQGVGGRDGISEYYMYDATNIRLRELSIGYTVPAKIKGIRNIYVSLIGRNLFFVTKKAPFDPEISMATNNGLQGTETFGIPSTRSLGFSVKLGF